MNTATQAIYPADPAKTRFSDFLARGRDWLDSKGRPAWIAAMILGFIAFWPVGLALLTYMIWSKRMFGCNKRSYTARATYAAPSTGNHAFDAYREQTLKRLEDEHNEFIGFLQKLREAKDKAEFDQFMESRAPKDAA
ncbi:DUF2852 domain-containing protein [Paracoccus sp. JM45]|uniref:DUF2852 domain-containing protein n=1 Tax=Paracoccus sp. JM45 TaxID=2283626 RepID=UPI000E6CF4A9|nr:DUF2852 domain-containing protein [Paracoccus sp. JM45]RJE79472.1 DUF2852 domain-containing protein [Paracoccus sp. JM45]